MYYGMSLSDVERSYGCYAEYARSMEEDDAYISKKQEEMVNWCQKNKKLLEEAEVKGQRIDFAPDCCQKCPHYTDIGPTWSYYGEMDDWEHGRCDNPACPTFITP